MRSPPGAELSQPVADPLLDAMAFSRGRFTNEQSGQVPLVIPAYAEIGTRDRGLPGQSPAIWRAQDAGQTSLHTSLVYWLSPTHIGVAHFERAHWL